MSTLQDTAYTLFGFGALFCDDTIPQLCAACPGHSDSEYREAFESVTKLVRCADALCNEWVGRLYTEAEATEKMRESCPGFSETSYQSAWNRALNFVHK